MQKNTRSKLSKTTSAVLMGVSILLSGCGTNEEPEVGAGSGSENVPPIASNFTVTLQEGETQKYITLANHVSDLNGDPVTITAVSATYGTVIAMGGSGIQYSSAGNAAVSDEILYVVSDGQYEASGRISLAVESTGSQTNSAPLVVDDQGAGKAGASLILDVLANDIDPEGDVLSIANVTSAHGTVEVTLDGMVAFTPNIDFSGLAEIDYIVTDGQNNVSGRVSVDVSAYTLDALLSWAAPEERIDGEPLDPMLEISGYSVLYKKSDWNEWLTKEVVGPANSVQLSDLELGVYTVRIAAIDDMGVSSDYAEVTAAISL